MSRWGLFLVLVAVYAQAGETPAVLQPVGGLPSDMQMDLRKLQIPKDLKLDVLLNSSNQLRDLQKTYLRSGGDISGGGFGLQIKGGSSVLLHDLWCENRQYRFQEKTLPQADALVPRTLSDEQALHGWRLDLKTAAPVELALAMKRLQAWEGESVPRCTRVEPGISLPSFS